MDLATILKAMHFVGPATEAAKAIVEGFKPLLAGNDQAELQRQYEAARARSDTLHAEIQRETQG